MIQPGLERISRLLARIPLPWRAIHVAGTNGKGSICAYVSRMLDAYNDSEWRSSEANKAVLNLHPSAFELNSQLHRPISHGRFTSPHLVDRWDCITINQKPVSWGVFHAVETRVKERNEIEGIGASEFELLTATAFEIFNDERVDVGVVEVGMGGLQDATNIIGSTEGIAVSGDFWTESFRPVPLVTAISKISLDHQAFLGDTLEEIARQKAGIIKPGVPVVYDDSDMTMHGSSGGSAVGSVIESIAAQHHSPVINLGFSNNAWPAFEQDCISRLQEIWKKHDLPNHQYYNATISFTATWSALQQLGRVPPRPAHGKGMESQLKLGQLALAQSMLEVLPTTKFPGRQQIISIEQLTGRKEPVLLDGAHNKNSSDALAPAVTRLRNTTSGSIDPHPVTWVIALSNTKDPDEVLGSLLQKDDHVLAVEFGPVDGMPWVKPLSSHILQKYARPRAPGSFTGDRRSCGDDVLLALQSATEVAQGGPMVIAGSLYLVQDVLRLLRTAAQTTPDLGPQTVSLAEGL